jgi:hypothetical protein
VIVFVNVSMLKATNSACMPAGNTRVAAATVALLAMEAATSVGHFICGTYFIFDIQRKA